jgi:hypothetical protein
MYSSRSEGIGWGGQIGIAALVLVILALAGLAIYGGMVHPAQHAIEQVLSNDRFPS